MHINGFIALGDTRLLNYLLEKIISNKFLAGLKFSLR